VAALWHTIFITLQLEHISRIPATRMDVLAAWIVLPVATSSTLFCADEGRARLPVRPTQGGDARQTSAPAPSHRVDAGSGPLPLNSNVPTCRRSTIGGRAFPVAGAKVWNGQPGDVTSASSLSVFKNRLKTYLFRRCYETV